MKNNAMINRIEFEGINQGIIDRNDKIIKFKLENIGNSKKKNEWQSNISKTARPHQRRKKCNNKIQNLTYNMI